MSIDTKNNQTATEKNTKTRRPVWLVVLLIVFIILFLLTSALIGARLYEMATRDQYTVDLELGESTGKLELFRIEYENGSGDVTVKGVNADHVVAPGTSVDYDVRLRNNDDVIIDFMMVPNVEFLNGDPVPVEFKIVDAYGNYVLGSESQWASADAMNDSTHKGSIHPGEVYTYHISWQWAFEGDDAYDTYLGSQTGEDLPGVRVSIETDSSANPVAPRDNKHMAHLLGDGFGCCWCCYLIWLLILVCLVLVIWVWKLKRKLNKLERDREEDQKNPSGE